MSIPMPPVLLKTDMPGADETAAATAAAATAFATASMLASPAPDVWCAASPSVCVRVRARGVDSGDLPENKKDGWVRSEEQ